MPRNPQSSKRRVMNDPLNSGEATGGQGGVECPPDCEKFAKNQGKIGETREKIWKKILKNRETKEKLGRKCKNRDRSFILPLLTDRAGYATAPKKV